MIKKQELPIYLRTRDTIVAQIEKGDLKAHDALPSERLLADQLGISRMTARQALVEVEKSGYAYRKGRQGRYVVDQRLSIDVGSTLSFATRALQDSVDLSIDVVSTSTQPACPSIATCLSIAEGVLVHAYKRVFKVNNRIVMIERETAIASRFPDLLEQDLSQPSSLLHESRYGVLSARARVKIRCVNFSEEDSTLFQNEASNNGMELISIIFDNKGTPFCHGHQLWGSEYAEFTLTARP